MYFNNVYFTAVSLTVKDNLKNEFYMEDRSNLSSFKLYCFFFEIFSYFFISGIF